MYVQGQLGQGLETINLSRVERLVRVMIPRVLAHRPSSKRYSGNRQLPMAESRAIAGLSIL
jgi:hypothetical protein